MIIGEHDSNRFYWIIDGVSGAETIGATFDIRNHPKGGVIMTCMLPVAARTSAHRRVSR
jgi:hypothetical protein